ncbi:hypothetical protein [Leuconostoc mesenteroides]|uniref:Uncharacterized protein n=1 Tax=Leuconostoc mesenteroides subsp. cremoris ATCC 19254 TaxID=586220 RepID=C2KI23_LEUMC|nr:hypothetical protein [Leuconostoc mesenteroides]EEJ43068.1 hypothetical protein HMPREF0555_0289 [Leuconostoc mesenteroides subsp. cremoris ATCC 19254]MBZ1502371.1 hypothetical protein [Leuconostoc mesenteroides]MDG9750221.1 hypothetical protein [Leuconostoc mesenteroides]RDF91961.1 hypothetical protein DQM09_05690 [Leuconostoc mesenteroides subsp. mesenteroides]
MQINEFLQHLFYLSIALGFVVFLAYWNFSFHRGKVFKSIKLRNALLRAVDHQNILLTDVDEVYKIMVMKSWVVAQENKITLHIPNYRFWKQVNDNTTNNILHAVSCDSFTYFLSEEFSDYSFSPCQRSSKSLILSGSKN